MNLQSASEYIAHPVSDSITRSKEGRIAKGQSLIDLSMINPDLEPARLLLDKLSEATINSHNHRYTVARGVRKTREAFAQKYECFGVNLDSDKEVCVTLGTKDALWQTLRAVAEPGEKVLVGAPTYPAYLAAIHHADLLHDVVNLQTTEEELLSSIENALATENYRAILLNFPNNPTGQMVSKHFWQKLALLVKNKNTAIINDFVYGEMGFKEKPVSALCVGLESAVVETYSLSKAYNVPGWRVGAACGNREIISKIARIKSQVDYGLFLPIQMAAAAALTAPRSIVELTVSTYERRAKVLVEGLSRLGWNVQMPKAGASVWAKLPENTGDSVSWCAHLLGVDGIATTPGTIFGESFSDYVRFALVVPEEKLRTVVSIIEKRMNA